MVTDIEINLIEGLKERSPKAQQTMVERYGRHVFSQVVRLLPSVEDAEEVYQDVFLNMGVTHRLQRVHHLVEAQATRGHLL